MMSRYRRLGDQDIVFALHDDTDSEDEDSLVDPNFVPVLNILAALDSIKETLGNYHESPSFNTEIV